MVAPSSLPVNSPDTTLTIYGPDFNPTSEVFADVTRLQTKYLDPTHLEAVLPAFLTAFPAILNIVIVTRCRSLPIVSQPYPFITYRTSRS